MRFSERLTRCLVIVGLALAIAAPGQLDRGTGGGDEPGAGPARTGRARTAAKIQRLASSVANPSNAGQLDPLLLPQALFDLDEAQNEQLGLLCKERDKRKQELIDALNKEYVEKAKDLLPGQVAERYDQVLAALQRFQEAVRTASDDLAAAVGQEAAAKAKALGAAPELQLVWVLDLTKEQDQELTRLRKQRAEAIAEAIRVIPRPENRQDRDAWRQYRELFKAASERAKVEYAANLKNLLTAQQAEQLAKLEQSVRVCQEGVQAARERFKTEMKQALEAE